MNQEIEQKNEVLENENEITEIELEEVDGFDLALIQGCGDIDYRS